MGPTAPVRRGFEADSDGKSQSLGAFEDLPLEDDEV
jgi:hypothetical protein